MEAPSHPDCISQGKTKLEAIDNIRESIAKGIGERGAVFRQAGISPDELAS